MKSFLKKILLPLFFLSNLLIVGCATGPINPIPPVKNTNTAAHIYMIRNITIFGGAVSNNLTMDNVDIFEIRTGQYIKFAVNPGKHTFGVKCFGGIIPKTWYHKITVSCAPKKDYYLLVSPAAECAQIRLLNKTKGLGYVAQSKLVFSH